MMTDPKDMQHDAMLEDLFEKARAKPPQMPDGLMARVLADAVQVQPDAPFSWRAIWQAWGGARGASGLVAATLVGVWLGVSHPAMVPDVAGALILSSWEAEVGEDSPYLTGFGWDFEEG